MVPPADGELDATVRRRTQGQRRRSGPSPTVVRRRVLAALAIASVFALALWTLWPSSESSSPERRTADLSAAAVVSGSDPVPVAEEPPPSPTGSPSPGTATVPKAGTGTLRAVSLPPIAPPTVNPNRTVRVGLQVEEGADIDAVEAARIVSQTLGDPRGWQTENRVRFRAVGPAAVRDGEVDITIVIASPTQTDALCKPLRTNGQVSCFNLRKAVLNSARWMLGVQSYGTELAAYRQYMVNHEVGHGLYHGHVECTGKGALAPIMLQQTKGLDGCRPNAWPTLP